MFCVYLSLATFARGLWIAKLQSQCITSRNNCIRTCGLNHVRLLLFQLVGVVRKKFKHAQIGINGFKEAGIVAAIEDPCAIAVGGELEGDEDPFANLQSEED